MWKGLWIGAAIGGFIGLLGGIAGAVGGATVFGFIGWVIGIIATAGSRKVPVPDITPPRTASSDRVASLESRVAILETRVARLQRGIATDDAEAGDPVAAEAPPTRPAGIAGSFPKPIAATDTPSIVTPAPADMPPPIPVDAAAIPATPRPAKREAPEEKFMRTIPVPIPPEPEKPNPIIAWFTGGNTIVRVGIVVLFIGLAFLVRYSVEHNLIPVELRIAAVGFVGIVLLAVGWRLRLSRPGYALSLQGAGVAIMYLTVFGALRLYSLIPPEAAFPLLVIIAAAATWLAVKQDSQVLAGFGAVGGFVAPVLVSTGHGNHVVLFTYFAILNFGVLTTAYFKSWRSLNLIGFVFTFVIATVWGARSYRPEHFATVEPFLILFFLMYVAIAVLFSRKSGTEAGRLVDGTLVFGVPLVAFGLQSQLVNDTEYGLAISAVILAAFYLGLASFVYRRWGDSVRLLTQAFLAMGIVFITVAIPLAFDKRWTSAAWAIEGAAVLWMGAKQKRWLPQAFGALVQLAAGISFGSAYGIIPREWIFLNGVFMGFVLIAAAGLFSHRALRRAYPDGDSTTALLRVVPFVWGLAWWFLGMGNELHHFLGRGEALNAFMAVVTATMLGLASRYRGGDWPEAGWLSNVFVVALGVFLLVGFAELSHPFAFWGWAAWTFAIVAHLVARKWVEDPDQDPAAYESMAHTGAFLIVAVMGSLEMRHGTQLSELQHTAWSAAALLLVPCTLVLLASARALEGKWPVERHLNAYRVWGAGPLVAALFVWMLFANLTRPGPSTPLPYIPLLNAIDLGHGLIAITVFSWWKAIARAPGRPESLTDQFVWFVVGASAFLWANAVLLRSLHHWADVPYHLDAWTRSFIVQASISIFWSVLALGIMVFATRKAHRGVWMIGAALMAVVVAKLAIVDLSRLGGLERIFSFIGVGLLMLVIGYFSPVPPKAKEKTA